MCIATILLSLLVALAGCNCYVSSSMPKVEAFVLIDPGHGGFDGGTVAENGTCEKHLNLAISLLIRDVLTVSGVSTTLTRESDVSLAENAEGSIRSRKVSDMKQRLALYEQAKTVISIHQNHFGSSEYHGAQVFYSANNPEGVVLATHIQQSVKTYLQPENKREIKQATNGIYLLHHTQQPAVLVECGFLSNPNERTQLESAQYQQQIAFAIVAGYFHYLSQK